jgi:hypothetical protein
MRGHSVKRYKKIRSLYIGQGNKPNISKPSILTPAELAEGRKRAKAYYTIRNFRIYVQIVFLAIISIGLVCYVIIRYFYR